MKELLEDLKALLEKHSATIELEEDEGFLTLSISTETDTYDLDNGYRDFLVSKETLERNIKELDDE